VRHRLPGRLQALLAGCYQLELDADIERFLLTDRAATSGLIDDPAALPDEALLISEADQTLDVTLFLDAELLERLASTDPLQALDQDNLDDFCRVLEGVSHFVCLLWKASNARSVTQLELEVQAEVDKYLSARLLLESQSRAPVGDGELTRRLFAGVRYREGLDSDQLQRYRHANDLALRFCRRLEQRHPAPRMPGSMLQELRAFYRMPQADKLSHINARQFD
jgi:hypothetical protein